MIWTTVKRKHDLLHRFFKKKVPASQKLTNAAFSRPGGYCGALNTRSHSEHGREMPQRQWYFVLRHGRVGRCQVCQMQLC